MKKKTMAVIGVLVVLAAGLTAGGFWLATRWNENKPYASYKMDEYIKLGKYTDLEAEFTQPDVSAERILELTKRYFMASDVSILKEDEGKKTVQAGDFVQIGFEGEVPGVSEHIQEGLRRAKWELEIGRETFIPGFDEQLIGRPKSEEPFEFKLKYPADFYEPELAGKECTFTCVVHAIGALDITDERAKELQTPDGMGLFQTVEELQTFLKEELTRQAKAENEKLLLEAAFANAKVLRFPDEELTYCLESIDEKAEEAGQTAEEYIAAHGYTGGMEQYTQEVRGEIERELFMFAVAKKEGLLVTTQEFRGYLETLRGGDETMTNQAIYEQYGKRGAIIRTVTRAKVIQFLAKHAKGYPNLG